MSERTIYGNIVSFNRETCVGDVTIDLTAVRFHSTSYHGRSWPRVGQRVEVVFANDGSLLALHEVEGSP